MKILVVLFTFYSSLFMSNTEQMPDYNPRSLQTNLKKITGCDSYSKEELIFRNLNSFEVENGRFYRISCAGEDLAYVFIGRVNSCRAGGCSIDRPHSGEFEFFDYYAVYDTSFSVVQVNVYNYEATHGQEITAKGWLKQFVGYHADAKLETGKNIDAISGATISVNGIVEDVKEKTQILANSIKAQ